MRIPTQLAQGPIARGTIRTTGVLGLRLVVQAGTLLLVARMLGPAQFGAFAGVAALGVILGTLATFGTNVVLLAEVAKKPQRRDDVLSYAVPFTCLCGVVLLAVYLAVCLVAFREARVPLTALLAIGITETLLQPLFTLPAAEQLALGRIARSQLLTILPLALRLIAAAIILTSALPDPLLAYGFGYCAASLLALIVATVTMPTPWPSWRAWHLPRRNELRNAAGYAAMNISATSPAELDKTLATHLLTLATSGLYAAGARVIGAATLPVIAMLLSALPRLFREGHVNMDATARLLRWIFAAALAYSILLAALLWIAAPTIVWLFGPRYEGLQHILHWLMLAVPGMALRIASGSVLMSLAKPWIRVGFELVGLTILTTTAFLLTSHLGTIGMPLALACSEWVMAAIGMVAILWLLRSQRHHENCREHGV